MEKQVVQNNKNFFWLAFMVIVIIEFLSLIAYQGAPKLQPWFLGLFLLGAFIISIKNIEYGLLIVFGELFVSSFGHLFAVDLGPALFSLRMGLFMVFNTTFFFYSLIKKSFPFRKSIYFWPNNLIFLSIGASFIIAFLNGNDLKDIFNDADGYAFFAYVPAALTIFSNKESRDRLFGVLKAALFWLGAQTIFVLFVFAHRLPDAMQVIYLWIRDARIGEITRVAGDFYRIFFQSYNFALLATFIFGVLFMFGGKLIRFWKNKNFWLFAISIFLVLEGFSRSFWFGGFLALLVMISVMLSKKVPLPEILHGLSRGFLGIAAALVMIFIIVNFPLPPKGPPIFLADIFGGRALALFDEAAASSRWQLLPPLISEIKKSPIFGAGFGKTITYKSNDPRILAEDSSGLRTTFAFEWGYLDMWLKLGLLGMFAYGWLIVKILKRGWIKIKTSDFSKDYSSQIVFGFWLGTIALLAANIFTPYLNHPLGIGALVMAMIFFI